MRKFWVLNPISLLILFFLLAFAFFCLLPRKLLLNFCRLFAFILSFFPFLSVQRNINVLNHWRQRRGFSLLCVKTTKREYLYYQLKNLVDFMIYIFWHRQGLEKIVRVEGNFQEFLDLYSRKKGIVGIGIHLGNWELGGRILGDQGILISSLVFRQLDPALEFFMSLCRLKMKVGILHQRGGLREAVRRLNSAELVMFIADQDGTRNGHFTRFCDLYVSFPRALELFLDKTEAALVPMVLLHDGDNYLARYEKQIERQDLFQIYDQIRDWYESLLLSYPQQWLLFYDRFKFRHESKLEEEGILAKIREEFEAAWKNDLE